MSRSSYHLITFLFLVLLLSVSLFTLNTAFINHLSWRDSQTFSVARNFLEESFNIFRPQYDLRGTGSGILTGEFPLYNAICAIFFKVFGTSTWVARFVNLLFSLGICFISFKILKKLKVNNKITLPLVTVFYFSNSVLLAQSASIMPETTSNVLALLSLYFVVRNQSYSSIFLSLCFLTLSTLVKPSGFAVIVPIFFLFFRPFNSGFSQRFIFKNISLFCLLTITPIISLMIWKNYALSLEYRVFTDQYVGTLFHHYHRDLRLILSELTLSNMYHAVKKVLLHGLNITGLFSLVYLIYMALRKRSFNSIQLIPFFLWLSACLCFLFLAGNVQTHQNYYANPSAIAALFGTILILQLLKKELLLLIVSIQVIAGLWYHNKNFLASHHTWKDYKLEKKIDSFSTRKDLFIAYPFGAFSTPLGIIGRRGITIEKIDWITNKQDSYKYLYVDKNLTNKENFKKINELFGKDIYNYKNHFFYELNEK